MERIQRALELARMERARLAANGPATVSTPGTVHPAQFGPPAPTPLPPPVREIPLPEQPTELPSVVLDPVVLEAHHVVLPSEQSAAAAAYRMLRTQLLQRMRGSRSGAIGIVSAADGEGKTLTATNLALSMAAEPNQTVVLLDLDLRKPGIAPLLGIDCRYGLDSWFTDAAQLDEVCLRVAGLERLLLLPSKAPLLSSSDVLAGPRTARLLTDLKGRQQECILIVDLPPALLANDVLTIAPLLDGVLIVVTEGRTRRDDLQRLRELLSGVRILGTVLNDSSQSERRAY